LLSEIQPSWRTFALYAHTLYGAKVEQLIVLFCCGRPSAFSQRCTDISGVFPLAYWAGSTQKAKNEDGTEFYDFGKCNSPRPMLLYTCMQMSSSRILVPSVVRRLNCTTAARGNLNLSKPFHSESIVLRLSSSWLLPCPSIRVVI